MSDLIATVEKAVSEALSAWGTSSALGQEEQAVVSAVLKLVASPGILNAIPVIRDLLAIVATRKANPVPAAPAPEPANNHEAPAQS